MGTEWILTPTPCILLEAPRRRTQSQVAVSAKLHRDCPSVQRGEEGLQGQEGHEGPGPAEGAEVLLGVRPPGEPWHQAGHRAALTSTLWWKAARAWAL